MSIRPALLALLLLFSLAGSWPANASQSDAPMQAPDEEAIAFGLSETDMRRSGEPTASPSPFENDSRNLEAAVQLKNTFRVRPGGVELVFEATRESGAVPALDASAETGKGGNQVGFDISARTCLEPFGVPGEPQEVSICFRTHPGMDFVPLSENMTFSPDDPHPVSASLDLREPCDER